MAASSKVAAVRQSGAEIVDSQFGLRGTVSPIRASPDEDRREIVANL